MGVASYDAVVVGAGPNGLGAAVTLARAGRSVLVVEGAETPGGGARSAELTLPGYVHDVCSAVHPFALASPLFRDLRLDEEGLRFVHPPVPLAHPLGGSAAAALHRSIDDTVARLGGDGGYRRLMEPLAPRWREIVGELVGPPRLPRHPFTALRFARHALRPASDLARERLQDPSAQALFAGIAMHGAIPLERRPSAAFGLLLGLLGHAVGWPLVRGGSQRLIDALIARLRRLGGEIVTGCPVERIEDLPEAESYLFDVSPGALARIAGRRLPEGYRRRLEAFRYGSGVCKVDYAVERPPPWSAPICRRAGTLHLGGTLEEMERSRRAVWRGEHPEAPFVLLAQPTLFDRTRAPPGRHCVWAYCHVPAGSGVDCSAAMEAQIERFAPGFRDTVLARRVRTAEELEAYNPNYVGGDINCGVQDLRQLFARPSLRLVPYATPDPEIYLCSSATPPGGGVHGLCGYFAALAALRASSSSGTRTSSTPGIGPKTPRDIATI